jgi:Ca2+-binding RTX toxin-like protein
MQRLRIGLAITLATALGMAGGAATAAPADRVYAADFRDSSGNILIKACVVDGGSFSDLRLRFTKVSQQGPHMRSADVTATGFTDIGVAALSGNSGWTSSDAGNVLSLSSGGSGQLKQGEWVQMTLSGKAPDVADAELPKSFTWPTTAAGPNGGNGPQYAIQGSQPTVTVDKDSDKDGTADACDPTPTPTPTPPATPPGGPTTAQQSGAGTPCISPTITGGVGDSLIIGTPGNDVILDLLGNNHVEGRGGNDTVCTGPGNDVVLTLAGTDVAFDQGGNNLIRTEAGVDTITTARGNSRVNSGTGADKVKVGPGKNQVRLGKGRDSATGDTGNDRIWGAAGKDAINGLTGNNRLNGGKGNDKLRAGNGKDRMNGGRNRDTCRAAGGRNRFRGCEVARGKGA